MQRNAVVLQHVAYEDLGSLEEVLLDHRYQLRTLQLGVAELDRVVAEEPELLIVLGGPISVNDGAMFPFLHQETAILRSRLALDRPCLGICLGAQLMSAALGGTVAPMLQKEIGWGPLQLGNSAREHALSALEGAHVLHWHGEQYTLPEQAVGLASTKICQNQAFQFRQNGLALQFHPEVTTSGLERWLIGHAVELTAANVDIQALRGDTLRHGAALRERAQAFFDRWLTQLTH
jgi:GMP synthase (glutamine-hydrolysing)